MKKESIKKLKSTSAEAGILLDPLSREQLKAVIGGDSAFASEATKTHSGSTCDGTAVCNCKCPPIIDG